MLRKKTERTKKNKKDDAKLVKGLDICEEFIKGQCLLGSKCSKKHKRNQFQVILQTIDPSLLIDSDKRYYLRGLKTRKEGTSEEDEGEEKVKEYKEKMKGRKSRKERNKRLESSKVRGKDKKEISKVKKAKNLSKEKKKENTSSNKKELSKPSKEKKMKTPSKEKKEDSKPSKEKNNKNPPKKENKKNHPKEKEKIKPLKEKKNTISPLKGKKKNPSKEKKEKKPPKEKKFTMMTGKTIIMDDDCKDFLNGECPKTFCDKIHNYTLKYKEQNNEEFARRYFTYHQDFTVLEPFQRKLYGNSCLDLMFLVDCTGSMSGWISTVKNELKDIITFIKDNNPYSKIKVSFVGYRDYDLALENRNSVLNFTEDLEEAKKFISSVSACGGADTAEDIAGGLKIGLEQDWGEKSAKYCILICDAPCHGNKYHNTNDTYPKGCPSGLIPEELIQEFARKEITFYAVKITDVTDIMFKIFSDSYQEISKQPIIIADLGQSTNKFAFLVAVAAENTLSSVTINNISLREFLNAIKKDATVLVDEVTEEFQLKLNNFVERVNTLVVEKEENNEINEKNGGMIVEEKEESKDLEIKISDVSPIINQKLSLEIIENKDPQFNNLSSETLEAICHSFYVKKDRYTNINWKNPFIQNSNMKSKVTVSTNPFSEGCNRYAFYMKDVDLNQNLVAKIPKNIIAKDYTIDGLAKELETITICSHIVNDFNDRIVNLIPDTRLLLNFIHCYIYEILDQKHPYKYYTSENYIQGEYVKYNNNAGWISQNVTDQTLLAQTFSHFSWQITKGYLTVVDLQGVGGFLTDPQIHCLNQKKYGNGNFGYIGIMKFFMSHNCNSYCKRLELIHPKNFVKIDKDYSFFIDKYVPPNATSKIYKLCDICRNPFQANSLHLYNLKKKCWEAFCDDCENKRKNSFKGGKCTVCGNFFKSAAFLYKMKRLSFPDKCMKCRQEDANTKRDEYYKEVREEEKEDLI